MSDEETVSDDANDEVKRRATFTPPPVDAEFPDNLGELNDEDIQAAKRASEAAAQQRPAAEGEPEQSRGPYQPATPIHPAATSLEPGPPTIPPAPTRSSLPDEEIMARFSGGTIPSTEGMMSALESQLSLRTDEDERFARWEDTVRELLPDEQARDVIQKARLEFGGLPPVEEPESVTAATPKGHSESPRDTERLIPVGSDPRIAALVNDPDEEGDLEPANEFDTVMSDHDAVSPPTSQWPLVIDNPKDEETVDQKVDVESVEDEPAADQLPAEDGAGGQDVKAVEEPTLASPGVSVGTDTVRISEVVAAKQLPTDSLELTAVEKERWFAFDRVGIEPSADVNRTAGIVQLFWTWWATSIPLAGIMIGAWLMAAGNGVIQALVATVLGVVVGSLPLLAGTVVGIRWGLPTLIASRAAFGLSGNILPSAVMLLIRLAVSAFLLWAAVWMASGIYVEANLWRLDPVALEIIVATVAIVIVGALAMVGRRFVALMLWVSSGLSLLAAVVLAVLSWGVPTRSVFEATGWDISLLVSSTSLVAAVFFIIWAQSGADVSRFATPGRAVSGTSVVAVAALVPPMVFIAWGVMLGASAEEWRSGILTDPFGQVLSLAPSWYPIPALVLLAVPLLGLAALALHSSSYALMSLGFAVTRYISAAVVTVVAAAIVFGVLIFLGDPSPYLVDAIRLVGVVVAAWSGVFVADLVTRRAALAPGVLLGTSGSYPTVRIAPLAGFVLAVTVGWGFTVSSEPVIGWLGFIVRPLTDLGVIDLGPYQLGVGLALVVSFVVAALAGIRGGLLNGSVKEKVSDE